MKAHLTRPIKRNWKARFLSELFGPVKVTRLQRLYAALSNPLIGGVREIMRVRYWVRSEDEDWNFGTALRRKSWGIIIFFD